MDLLARLLNLVVPLLYLVLTYFYGVHFLRSERRTAARLTPLLYTVLAIHLADLLVRGVLKEHFPAANIAEVASLIAFSIILIYVYIERYIGIKSTGFFILFVACLLQIFSTFAIDLTEPVPGILESRMFVLHTIAAIIGYSALLISALYGLMYLMLFYELKSAQFGLIYRRMPSLEELSDMNFRAAIIGFLFLTATIFVGILWRKAEFPDASHFDPKVIASYGVWLMYGGVIAAKQLARWTGKWVAYSTVLGFILIVISIVIINMMVTSFHRFG